MIIISLNFSSLIFESSFLLYFPTSSQKILSKLKGVIPVFCEITFEIKVFPLPGAPIKYIWL